MKPKRTSLTTRRQVPSSINGPRIGNSATGRESLPSVQQEGPNAPQEATRYRASLPIMVLAFRDNHHAAVTIPAGEVFEVLGPEPNDDRFNVVKVKGEELLVFESDLKQCGKPVYLQKAKGV